MERYYLGNNTAHGFKGCYEDEIKTKSKVILLKGGPGTGKSSLLKKVAAEAKSRGYDYELWYCSGDPSSLDGVYVKDVNAVVTDATAPHATGADLPKMRDFIYDLAEGLSQDKLNENREEIEALLNCKKKHFIRAYQHLNIALCHKNNQIALESLNLKQEDIRAYASVFAAELRSKYGAVLQNAHKRKLFTHAISPSGENVYYDHLRGKRIYRVAGGAAASAVFFDELLGTLPNVTVILDPLDGKSASGIMFGDVAIVGDAGHFSDKVCEVINLCAYERFDDIEGIEEEKNNATLQIAFAVERLNKARENHLAAEKYFIDAMNFGRNEEICKKIIADILG